MKIELSAMHSLPVSRQISEQDGMFVKDGERHYFSVGLSNLYATSNACRIRRSIPGGERDILDILDFGCGHGRVARFLRAGFPKANVWVTDLNQDGVAFCVKELGCLALTEDPQPDTMDLIWLGSVFTHLPEVSAKGLLNVLLGALRPGGLLIFTTQGRYSCERVKNLDWLKVDQTPWVVYNLSKQAILDVCAKYEETGYGYVNYPNQEDYGIAIVKPAWYEQYCGPKGVQTIYFQERACDNHQDIIAFMRTDILDSRTTPFWDIAQHLMAP